MPLEWSSIKYRVTTLNKKIRTLTLLPHLYKVLFNEFASEQESTKNEIIKYHHKDNTSLHCAWTRLSLLIFRAIIEFISKKKFICKQAKDERS